MANHFGGAIFDGDGVLVDSPHERACRDAVKQIMRQWSDIPSEPSYSSARSTFQVDQQAMSGEPRRCERLRLAQLPRASGQADGRLLLAR